MRFTANNDGTVIDNLSGLVWEKKTNLDMSWDYANPHDADNSYRWSSDPNNVFSDFLTKLNASGFAGQHDWRLATEIELQTVLLDFKCTGDPCYCPSTPCIDQALDPANTRSELYWSSTREISFPTDYIWTILQDNGFVDIGTRIDFFKARAVRGGL